MSTSVDRQKALLVLRSWVLSSVGILSFIGFIVLLHNNWNYYALARMERPFHEAHNALRSSGRLGLWTGIIATSLFILNLGYLIRKKLIRHNYLGPLRMWMDLHVLTGLIGAGLIFFHSSMAPSSALGTLAVFALGVTVLTGLVGRTIYIQVPRSLEGHELEFEQVQSELSECKTLLELAGVQADWLNQTHSKPRARHISLIRCFMTMAAGYLQRKKEYRRLKYQVLHSAQLKGTARKILPLIKSYCIHSQWLMRYYELRRLITSWRFFHRWMAVLMLCVVICHVFVAIRFGDLHWLGTGHE